MKLLIQLYIIFCVLIELIKIRNQKKGSQSYYTLTHQGGDVYSGYGLISAMQDSITPIYTINQGMCASMAFLIFLAGSKRYSMRNSTFLMHDGSNGAFIESASKLRDRIEYETGQLEQLTKKFVLEHTTIDDKFYDEKYRVEWYMLPEEAKSHRICDYIIGKDCTLDEII